MTTTQSPIEIDTRIAAIDMQIMKLRSDVQVRGNMVRGAAGMRDYVRGRYVNSGTWAEAKAEIARRIELGKADAEVNSKRGADDRWQSTPNAISSWHAEQPLRYIAEADAMIAEIDQLFAGERAALCAEYVRRGRWSRFYVVTSSAGHVHSSTNCGTCRITTTFGWVPELSGMTEAEAMAALDSDAFPGATAETLCSVCFPNAPIAGKRANITKAKADKLAAGPVASE